MPSQENNILNRIRFDVEPDLYPDTDKGNLRLFYELEILKSQYEYTESSKYFDRYMETIDTLIQRGYQTDFSTDTKIDKAVRTVRTVLSEPEVVQKPFADYKDFADCVARNKDKGDPKAYCAEIMHRVEGTKKEGDIHIHFDGETSIAPEEQEDDLKKEYYLQKIELIKQLKERLQVKK